MKTNPIFNRSFALLTVVTLLLTSCEDFIQRNPISDITEEMLNSGNETGDKYTTADQVEGLLQSAYNDLASEFFQLDIFLYGDGQSDNCYSGEDKVQTRQVDEYRLDANNGTVARDWKYHYAQIAKANSVIEWAPKVKDNALTQTRRKEMVAEASFLRAYAYFYLVRMYGDVPLVTREIPSITSENIEEIYPLLYPKRATTEEVYKQIFEDIKTAENGAKSYHADKAKASLPTVYALAADVHAAYGAPNHVNWSEVQRYAALVTNDTRYGLQEKYNDLWVPKADGSGLLIENGKESLLEVPYKSWETIGNWAYQMFYGRDWKKFNTPSTDLIRAFNNNNDAIRLAASIKFEDVTGLWTDLYFPTANYPFCWKIRLNEKGHITLFRYAATLLLHAEAENELDNTGTAKTLLKRIRNRVELPDLTNTLGSDKNAIREAIALERRLELCFEGYRWFDLKRSGKAVETMRKCTDHQSEYAKSNLNENKLLWPIPQSERDKNSELTQNQGY